MKRKVFSFFLVVSMLTIMSIPALANTSSWDFTMDLRYVSGDDNGIYHNMTSGNMYISGSVWVYSIDDWHAISPLNVYIEVWESRFGPDRYVGRSIVTPRLPAGTKAYFSNTLGSQSSGKYYIVAYKTDDDGFNIKGQGILETR